MTFYDSSSYLHNASCSAFMFVLSYWQHDIPHGMPITHQDVTCKNESRRVEWTSFTSWGF